MIALPAVALAALTTLVPLRLSTQSGDYPWASGCTAQDIRGATVILVEAQNRSSIFIRGGRKLCADRVRVLDSSSSSVPGAITILGLTTNTSAGPDLYKLESGHRYICVISTSVGSRALEVPGTAGSASVSVPKEATSEVLGLFACPTNLSTLTPGTDTVQALHKSVVSSLQDMTSYEVARATNFLYSCGPDRLFTDPLASKHKLHQPLADDDLTHFMKQRAHSSSPYVRAKILQLLVRWKIEDTELAYLRALVAASSDPTAFSVGNDPVDVDYSYGYSSTWEQTYPEPKLALDEWTSAITNANSRRILRFLLQNVEPVDAPAPNDLAAIATRLNDPDPEIRYLTVSLLCRVTGDSTHEATVLRTELGTTYPNLSSAVKYWRGRYGISPSYSQPSHLCGGLAMLKPLLTSAKEIFPTTSP